MKNRSVPSSFRSVASVALVVGLFATVTWSALNHHGTPAADITLSGGTAWFVDTAHGDASLLDGAAGVRISAQPVATPGNDIQTIQAGSGAFVVNHSTGAIVRIDGATLQPGRAVRFSFPGDRKLALVSNSRATWAIVQGGTLAEEIDPSSLALLGSPHVLSSSGALPVETPDGSLWTEGAGGEVYSFAGGIPHTRTHPAGGQFSLVEAGSRPVAADPSTGDAFVLDPVSGRVARSVPFNPPGTAPLITGGGDAPYVIAVGPTNGVLQITDLSTKRSATIPIGDPSADGRSYGTAVLLGDLIYVPDLGQGAVVVARVVHDRLTLLGQVPVDDEHFNLLSYDSSVWFDDPSSNLAGVITGNLDSILIPKWGGDGQGHLIGRLGPVRFGNGTSSTTPATTPGTTPATTPATTPVTTGTVPATSSPTSAPRSSHRGVPPTTSTTVASPPPSATTTTTIVSQPPPVPGFKWSPDPAITGVAVNFDDTSQGPHSVFQWVFPQGSPSTSSSGAPSVRWDLPGHYNVTLVVTEKGQSYAIQQQVVVVSRTTPCAGGTVTVNDWTAMVPVKTVTVPPGCSRASFVVNGADGGSEAGSNAPPSNYGGGGHGAQVSVSNYPVSPGQQLVLEAGRPGSVLPQSGNGCTKNSYECDAGFGGCGPAGGGGGGGGMSSVRLGASYLIIAGGGGGSSTVAVGDPGGGSGPLDGRSTSGGVANRAGGGQTPAGTYFPPQSGSKYAGGNGGGVGGSTANSGCEGTASLYVGGGGGGGGLYGGAGGAMGCASCTVQPHGPSQGGGGSDLYPSGAAVRGAIVTNKPGGAQTDRGDGAGIVTVTWS